MIEFDRSNTLLLFLRQRTMALNKEQNSSQNLSQTYCVFKSLFFYSWKNAHSIYKGSLNTNIELYKQREYALNGNKACFSQKRSI